MIKNLILVLTVFCGCIFADNGKYSIAVGEEDKDRLLIINEICNSFSSQFLKEHCISKGDQVLEIGCGLGIISQQLSQLVGQEGSVLATDLNEEQLCVARSLLNEPIHANLEFRQLAADEIESLDKKFDVVYIRFLLCHLPNPVEIISAVKNVLKPGGRFIIEDLTGNDTMYSIPQVKGMEILHYFDTLQFELQESDDHYFAKLPQLLEKEGYAVRLSERFHPVLDTLRKRKILTYNLSSLKDALLSANKITLAEYEDLYPIVEDLVYDLSVTVFSYEIGQICAYRS